MRSCSLHMYMTGTSVTVEMMFNRKLSSHKLFFRTREDFLMWTPFRAPKRLDKTPNNTLKLDNEPFDATINNFYAKFDF